MKGEGGRGRDEGGGRKREEGEGRKGEGGRGRKEGGRDIHSRNELSMNPVIQCTPLRELYYTHIATTCTHC